MGLLHTYSEVTLVPGDPKYHCSPPVRVRAYAVQIINEGLAHVCLTVNLVSLMTHPVVIFPVLECIIGIHILSNWQKPHIGLLTCGEKGQVEASRILPRKIINEKQYIIPGGIRVHLVPSVRV